VDVLYKASHSLFYPFHFVFSFVNTRYANVIGRHLLFVTVSMELMMMNKAGVMKTSITAVW